MDQEDKDPPFTSSTKKEYYEKIDEEKNKYLIFKNITGFDAVPRIREPTPERIKKAE